MTEYNTYENFNFDCIINRIDAENFPSSFSLHWHKYVEIITVPDNSTDSLEVSTEPVPPVIRINQKQHSLQPFDLVFIWPGELHEIISNKDNRIIGIQFPITLLSNLADFAQYLNLFRSYHHIRNANTPELAQNMVSSIIHMFHIAQSDEPFQDVETLICLYEMFMLLGADVRSNFSGDSLLSSSLTKQTIEKINNACSYITENCSRVLTLNNVAAFTGFSPHYFSRIFKKATAYSFIEYLTIQRVKNAQFLLSDTDLPITEISYRSGFKSISTFNRVFKKYKGCSPREFRSFLWNK